MTIEWIKETCPELMLVFIFLLVITTILTILRLVYKMILIEDMTPAFRENRKEYDFETWKEVQDSEVEYWYYRLFSELKNVANVDAHIGNWEHVKAHVRGNTEDTNVKEDFDDYNEEEWLEEIYIQIKPYFVEWLDTLLQDNEWDYYEYVNNFWVKTLEENHNI